MRIGASVQPVKRPNAREVRTRTLDAPSTAVASGRIATGAHRVSIWTVRPSIRRAVSSFAALVVIGILAACGGSGDGEVIDQLRAAGADLSQPREVRYYLYLPTEEVANDVADRVARDSRRIEVSPAATGSDWLVLITEISVVDESTMAARREEFESAVADSGGEYDGWEAAVEP